MTHDVKNSKTGKNAAALKVFQVMTFPRRRNGKAHCEELQKCAGIGAAEVPELLKQRNYSQASAYWCCLSPNESNHATLAKDLSILLRHVSKISMDELDRDAAFSNMSDRGQDPLTLSPLMCASAADRNVVSIQPRGATFGPRVLLHRRTLRHAT